MKNRSTRQVNVTGTAGGSSVADQRVDHFGLKSGESGGLPGA